MGLDFSSKINNNGKYTIKNSSEYKNGKITIWSSNHTTPDAVASVEFFQWFDVRYNITNVNIRFENCVEQKLKEEEEQKRKEEEEQKRIEEEEQKRKEEEEQKRIEEEEQKRIEEKELKQKREKRERKRLAEKAELLTQKKIKKDIEDDIKAREMRILYEANRKKEIEYKYFLKILFMSSILIFLVVYDTLFSRDSKLIKLKNNYNRIQIRRSRKAEEGRKAQESLKAEARRKAADESRKAEERKKAQESRKAEEKRKDDNYNDSQESNKSNKSSEKFETEEIRFGRILGLKGKPNLNEIKKRYRNNIKKYHPDKVAMLGDELIELAEEKTKELNEAYKYFMNIYN
jgi:DnaJ-domain-containing protein 1